MFTVANKADTFFLERRTAVFLCIKKKKADTFLPDKSVKVTTTNSC